MPFNTLEKRNKYKKSKKVLEKDRKYKAKLRLNPEYRERNKEMSKKWRILNPEKAAISSQKYSKEHRIQINQNNRKKYQKDPIFKIKSLLRSRLKDYKDTSFTTGGEYREFLGCSFDDLKIHLESLFKPGMSWNNHGNVWHIDHIIPLSLFGRLKKEGKEKEFDLYLEEAFHYTNLRPEWKKENLSRGNRWILINPNRF